VALDRLLGEVQPVADLTVHETLRDKLENLDLTRGRRVLWLRAGRTRRELDELGNGGASSRDRLEPARVLPIPRQDLFPLCCVHVARIGVAQISL